MTFIAELWVGRKSIGYNGRREWLVVEAPSKREVRDIIDTHLKNDDDVTSWTIDMLHEATKADAGILTSQSK